MTRLIHFKMAVTGIAGWGKRDFRNKIVKPMWEAVAQDWFVKVLPGHFAVSAYRKYASVYQSRAPKYVKRKRRKLGHNRPMVGIPGPRQLTPTLHDGATRSMRVQHTRDGFEIRLPGARKANLRPEGGRINMAKEITAVNQEDVDRMHRVADRWITRRLRKIDPRRIEVVR